MEIKHNVLLVDDHNLVLDGLELILKQDTSLNCCGRVNTGVEAITFAKIHPIDIILMDINLPDISGVEVTEKILSSHPNIKVIGLSMHNELVIIKSLIKKGAKGFLLKNSGKEEILQAIHATIKGDTFYDPEILQRMILLDQKTPSHQSIIPSISRREKEILKLIVKEYTTKEIADQLFISFGTVETHRRNLISKLGVRNTAGLVRMAIEFELIK